MATTKKSAAKKSAPAKKSTAKTTAPKSTGTKGTRAAVLSISKEEVANAFLNAVGLAMQFSAQNTTAPTAPAADVEDVEEEDEETEHEPLDREETEGLSIVELRALAKERLGEGAPKKKAEIMDALDGAGHFVEEDEEEEDEDEDEDEEIEDEADDEVEDEDDEEEDEDEEDELDPDELAEMSLKEIRALAKERGLSAADIRGKDQDELIEMLTGDEDEDEDEAEEEDEDDDEETEELDEDALNEMSPKELLALAKELDITVPAKVKKDKKALVNLILDSGDEE